MNYNRCFSVCKLCMGSVVICVLHPLLVYDVAKLDQDEHYNVKNIDHEVCIWISLRVMGYG